MPYKRAELISKVLKHTCDMPSFYKQRFINYRGRTSDTQELYTEVIAELLCGNLKLLDLIPTINRKSSYKTCSHDGQYKEASNRKEEKIAMDLFCMSRYSNVEFDKIGLIIDYQIPLKNTRSDSAGKIDLLSVSKDMAHILELKTCDSEETMLRCVLESFTYLKTLNADKCKTDYGLSENTCISASPLVFQGGYQQAEFFDKERVHLHRLISILDTHPIFLEKIGEKKYKVVK